MWFLRYAHVLPQNFSTVSQKHYQPFSRLADYDFRDIEAHCDKLWLSVRLPGENEKVLLVCDSVHLNGTEGRRIDSRTLQRYSVLSYSPLSDH